MLECSREQLTAPRSIKETASAPKGGDPAGGPQMVDRQWKKNEPPQGVGGWLGEQTIRVPPKGGTPPEASRWSIVNGKRTFFNNEIDRDLLPKNPIPGKGELRRSPNR
eukprot:12431484-Karenia_brevis.AAC.1